jgi:hypothetical protein
MWLARVRSEQRQMAPPGPRKHLVSLSAAPSPRRDRGPDFDRSHKLVLQQGTTLLKDTVVIHYTSVIITVECNLPLGPFLA